MIKNNKIHHDYFFDKEINNTVNVFLKHIQNLAEDII